MSEREAYLQQLQAQLEQWQADLAHLKALVAETHGKIHPEMKHKIKEYERRIAAAKAKLPELAAASEEDWEAAKADFQAVVFKAKVSKPSAR